MLHLQSWSPACPRYLQHWSTTCSASTSGGGEAASSSGDDSPLSSREEADKLNQLLVGPEQITGAELRSLVLDKYGVSYDMRLVRRGSRMWLEIMWKFLEQQSFPLTEQEYELQLDAVAAFLNMWEVQDLVRTSIKGAPKRGPGYTGGGNARPVSIALGVDVGGAGRSNEWNSF